MSLIIAFFYASILLMGLVGGWVLGNRLRTRAPSAHMARWIVVLFPIALCTTILVKPDGPVAWAKWIPFWGPWDKLLVVAVLSVVCLRGAWKIITVTVAWAKLRHESIPAPTLAAAPELEVEAMSRRLGLPAAPELRVHRSLGGPLLIGWRSPIVLFPARLVPPAYRSEAPFWDDMEHSGASFSVIKAMVAHELGHARWRDNLRLWMVVLTGCIVPWEWVVGRTDLEKSTLSRFRIYRSASSLLKILGKPYRWGIEAERRSQEEQADAAVAELLADGGDLIVRIRGLPRRPKPTQVPRLWEDWRELVFLSLLLGILAMAPGWSMVRFALEGKMTSLLALPATWALAMEPGYGRATAGRTPAEHDAPGKIVVDVTDAVPGHWPQLRGTGRFDPNNPNETGRLELVWDVQSVDVPPDRWSVMVQCAVIPFVEDLDQAALTVAADPDVPVESMGSGVYRFTRSLDLTVFPARPCWLYVKYFLKGNGRWTFNPPIIHIVTPDGLRHPFPSS